ncbi:MAG: hypothetical protein QOJ01_2294 [Solirubrobacterales bacterium]|jgi:hypothetical protein|nr:hypothetical protein [Solirubrobacterales bacterium]
MRRPQPLADSGGALRAVLILAIAAVLVVMLDLFSSSVRWGCLGVVAAVAAFTSPERQRVGSGWWDIFVVGLGVSVLAALLSGAAATLGGILALAGGALVVVASVLGFPPGE